jgi:hypothetical protein
MDARHFRKKKKNGQMRMCVVMGDKRYSIVRMKYPLPRYKYASESAGAHCFTKIDLNQAYYQIRVVEDSKKYTAMLNGSVGWNCMSFGLSNAPVTVSR